MADDRPDILFLMTDQQRWDALGCEQPLLRTPHLDRLAAEGVRFRQAVCQAPMCVASRYSMMLGLYPSQLGLRFNQQVIPDDAGLPHPVLAQHFDRAGYATCGVGKTHWYENWYQAHRKVDLPQDPQRRGFQERYICTEGGRNATEAGCRRMEDDFGGVPAPAMEEINAVNRRHVGESPTGYLGKPSAFPGEQHREGWYAEQAVRWVRRRGDDPRARLLYCSLDFPHAPQVVPPGWEDLYRIEDIPDRPILEPVDAVFDHHEYRGGEHRRAWKELDAGTRRRVTLRYYALCSFSDHCLGRVIEAVRASGRWERTLVVFTSDHGDMLGDRNHRFSKYCLYEGSVRVPLILSGGWLPARLRGTVDERPAALVDLLPTLLAAAGLPSPATLPGLDLLAAPRRAGAFAEFHGTGYEQWQSGPLWMWRTPQWKLILGANDRLAREATADPGEGRGELYDLAADPVELRDRWDDPACLAQRERLQRQLLLHVAAAFGRFPQRPTSMPVA